MKKYFLILLTLSFSYSALALPTTKICSCASNATTYINSDGSTTTVAQGFAWSQPYGKPCNKTNMIFGSGVMVTGMSYNNGPTSIIDIDYFNEPSGVDCTGIPAS